MIDWQKVLRDIKSKSWWRDGTGQGFPPNIWTFLLFSFIGFYVALLIKTLSDLGWDLNADIPFSTQVALFSLLGGLLVTTYKFLGESVRHVRELREQVRNREYDLKSIIDPFKIDELFRSKGIRDPVLIEVAADLVQSEEFIIEADDLSASFDFDASKLWELRERQELLEPRFKKLDEFFEIVIPLFKSIDSAPNDTAETIFTAREPRSRKELTDIFYKFRNATKTASVLKPVREKLWKNYQRFEGALTDYQGDNFPWAVFGGTPLLKLENKSARVSLNDRTMHAMMIGGSGSGKTTLLKHIISRDLMKPGASTTVVIDSQGQLINQLGDVDIAIERLAWLKPDWNYGINLFDVGLAHVTNASQREQLIEGAKELIAFVIKGVLDRRLTSNQSTMLQWAIEVMLRTPGANIFDLYRMFGEGGTSHYADSVNRLDLIGQEFFETEWDDVEYKKTRKSIRMKLQALLSSGAIKAKFQCRESAFDLDRELEQRDLILFDTDRDILNLTASRFLGRLYLAMIERSIFRRARKENAKPVYLVIDEAHEYLDEATVNLFLQARKGAIGVTFATQSIANINSVGIDPKIIRGNTATKFAATSDPSDANFMAAAMNTSGEFIHNLPQYTFAFYDRKQGVKSVRCGADPLRALGLRKNTTEVRAEMEKRYGVTFGTGDIGSELGQFTASESGFDLGDVEPI